MLPEGVTTPLTPSPVPPPVLQPVEPAATSPQVAEQPVATSGSFYFVSTVKTAKETAADVMFGGRSPVQWEASRESTPEPTDGKLYSLFKII